MNIEKLIRDIIDPLVTNKDALMIRQMPSNEENELFMLIIGESDDIARLIGRGGSVADSIREVVSVAGKLSNQRIRIKLKGYEHGLVDASAEKIVETARRTGAQVSGPIPLPTEKEVVTILRAVHKYKDSREQFEMRTHKRLIDIMKPSQKTVDALMSIELPAGVEIEVKL